jgi:SH3 domain-containing kinase-binding protein 1
MKKGDIITSVVQKMDGWWEGSLNGKTGMFPDNFVKIIEKQPSIPIPTLSEQKPSAPQNNVILRNNKSSRYV